ncbi:RNA polymerase II transcription factor B subunit 5 [Fusarium circinatum]|uniref:General transcription and DNA repair factor IIH subunit TFB5 n=1 Tax=Fusarium circinatum TaxID=48490 RepID=A0A8H5XC07_FUSCI|nr:RNA polymerase II transcription factor B subunit 5 [Fusarium circinatum]
MPRAIRGSPHTTSLSLSIRAYLPMLGVLIECDPSIKSIIVSIDSANHDYIIEDLDDERVVVKETMVSTLKHKLEERLKENLPPEEESGSE